MIGVMLRRPGPFPISLTVALLSPAAAACPDCQTSRIVRAAVLDDNFWRYLVLLSAPLVVLAVITALLYRIGLRKPGGRLPFSASGGT
jgi:hypothetical protein